MNISEMLLSEKEEDRLYAVERIKQDGLTEFADDLIDILKKDTSEMARESAMETLKTFTSPDVSKKIAKLFEEDDPFLRNAAVTILAAHWEAPLASLSTYMKSENKHIRKLALDSLHATGNPLVVDLIATALKDEDINNVISAVEYIADLEGYRYADSIADILKKAEDPFLLATCLEALAKIGNKYASQVVHDRFPDPAQLPDFLLFSYLRFIAHVGDEGRLPDLLKIVDMKGAVVYKECIDVIHSILDRCGDDLSALSKKTIENILFELLSLNIPPMNKYECLVMLGSLRGKRAIEMLHRSLKDQNPFVRMGAIEGIGKIGSKESIPILEELAAIEKNEDVKAVIQDVLNMLGKK